MPVNTAAPIVISVDWGLSSLRCRLLGHDGTIIASRQSGNGVRAVEHRNFSGALLNEIGAWIEAHPSCPVLLSGMIGSRLGWVEAPYVACPAGLAEIGQALLPLEAPGVRQAFIVPGMKLETPARADIMRGEECEVLGCLADPSSRASLYVAPGTHSKWIAVQGDRIVSFTTMMTGELFALLSGPSSLAEMVSATSNDDASFLTGLNLARQAAAKGGILPLLFTIRADGVLGRRSPSQSRSLLSGMLIGSELAFALSRHEASDLLIVGDDRLADRYQQALLQAFGCPSRQGPSAAAALGHLAIAKQVGITP
jgi:2-dehydro-3-deoxygalactonokinase